MDKILVDCWCCKGTGKGTCSRCHGTKKFHLDQREDSIHATNAMEVEKNSARCVRAKESIGLTRSNL